MINDKRFYLRNGAIYDTLTGYHYRSLIEITNLLNNINKRADENAEKYVDLIFMMER